MVKKSLWALQVGFKNSILMKYFLFSENKRSHHSRKLNIFDSRLSEIHAFFLLFFEDFVAGTSALMVISIGFKRKTSAGKPRW